MHEMALTESVLRILEQEAVNQRFSRVKAIWLEVGQLSHADPEAMRLCFDAVMRGSLAEGAKLEMVRTDGSAWCMPCAREVSIMQRYDSCPCCGGYQLRVVAGEEMRIKELEVE